MNSESRTTIESKRSTSPRPPAVGQEVRTIVEQFEYLPENSKTYNMECEVKPFEHINTEIPYCSSGTESADCIDSSSNSSPPAPHKWAQSLQCLLNDRQGVELFQQFLMEEGLDTRVLQFWFFCEGVKKRNPSDIESLVKIIHVGFDKQVRRISAISERTKDEIKLRLCSRDIDATIFDIAQDEVEAYISNTTYPNFLQSDLYIQHLDASQNKYLIENQAALDVLPTVHEDSELQITKAVPLTKHNLMRRYKLATVSKSKSEGSVGCLTSPYNYSSYHNKYGSYLPVSAQDSELQSLSSDAQTDDTMSLADSTYGENVLSKIKQRRQQKMPKHVYIDHNDTDLDLKNFIPRTARAPPSDLSHNPKEFLELLFPKLNKVLEAQKLGEKLEETRSVAKLNPSENAENSVPYLVARTAEENSEDILANHISRVFGPESGVHSPTIPAGCLSPGAREASFPQTQPGMSAPTSVIVCEAQQKDIRSVSSNTKQRRQDPDSISTDSAMFDYVSDDSVGLNHKRQQYPFPYSDLPIDYSKYHKEHSKRYAKRGSSMYNSSSTVVDSGISLACESLQRYSNRKAFAYLKSQNPSAEMGSQWSAVTEIVARNSSMPYFTSDAAGTFIDARRDEESRKLKLRNATSGRNSHDLSRMKVAKGYDSHEDGMCHKKISRKSCSGPGCENPPVNAPCNDWTVIGYSYGRHSVPYQTKYRGKNITFRQFKSLLSKKGNFQYFFKTASNDFGTGVVFEEVTDDCKVLPLWKGKVFCCIESMDDSPRM